MGVILSDAPRGLTQDDRAHHADLTRTRCPQTEQAVEEHSATDARMKVLVRPWSASIGGAALFQNDALPAEWPLTTLRLHLNGATSFSSSVLATLKGVPPKGWRHK